MAENVNVSDAEMQQDPWRPDAQVGLVYVPMGANQVWRRGASAPAPQMVLEVVPSQDKMYVPQGATKVWGKQENNVA